MKYYRLFLLLLAVFASFGVHSQAINATSSGYVQQSDGAYKTEQIYIRVSGGFNRTGFVVFPIKDLGTAFSASLNLAIKRFDDHRANPTDLDIHVAIGDLFSPLENATDAYASAPDTTQMTFAVSVAIDSTKSAEDIISIDLTSAINEANSAGTAEFITIRLNSLNGDALLQFYSNEESDQAKLPTLDYISDDDVVIQSPLVDGFLQPKKDFSTGDIYVRGQATVTASFHREGYVVLAQNEQFGILDAKLQLTARVDTRATGVAPDSIPQFIVSIAEGDLISGILNDETTDWDQRPADSNFSSLDTLDVNGVLAGEVVEIDLTDQINSFITGGTVQAYTMRLMDTTANKVLARFHTSSDEDETKRPKLVVIATCATELVAIDTVVCSTAVPFTLEAEVAANNITVTESGVYDLLFTTPCGAVSTRKYTVDVIVSGDFTENPEICAGEEFLGKTATETFTIEKVSSDGLCTENITYNLTVNDLPKPDLGEDQMINEFESTLLDAGIWESYLWSSGETTQTIAVEFTSDSYGYGDNEIIVSITDAIGCVGKDTVVVTIDDTALGTSTPFPVMRQDKDGFFDAGNFLRVKNDLYGDLQTPEGEEPFYSRVIFMEFDATPIVDALAAMPEGQVLRSAYMQMRNDDFSKIPDNADVTYDVNVEMGAAVAPVDSTWTWMTHPDQSVYPIVDVVTVTEASVPSILKWDLADFLTEDVLGAGASIFSLKFTALEDTRSTTIRFNGLEHSVVEERPRLIWEIGDKTLSTRGELKPNLMVYPNPSFDVITLSAEFVVYSYSIIDMNGKLIQQNNIDAGEAKISVSTLEKGIYLLRLETAEGTKTSRFIKK